MLLEGSAAPGGFSILSIQSQPESLESKASASEKKKNLPLRYHEELVIKFFDFFDKFSNQLQRVFILIAMV